MARRTVTVLVAVAALAAVVAIAVTPCAAKPSPQEGDQVLSIEGQSCKCVVFYSCESVDTVPIPSGSTGCDNNLVCCRIQGESPLPIEPTSTPFDIPQNPTTEYGNNNQGEQCTCVSKNQCSVSGSNSNAGDCGYNQVCCSENHIKTNQNTNGGGNNPDGHYNNNNNNQCGVGMSAPKDKHYGSTLDETYAGQFPWMVTVQKTSSASKRISSRIGDDEFVCSGSLIHPKVVLTAGHCVRDLSPESVHVKVGVWDTQASYDENTHQIIGISDIVVHPNFKNGSLFNDVALIKLDSEYVKHQHINTICIPDAVKKTNYDPSSCIVTGWGSSSFGDRDSGNHILRKVELPLVANGECQQLLRNTRLGTHFRLHESFICAGGTKGQDVCRGDGGGPLICAVKEDTASSEKKYVQVGIVSWGIGCGDENVPGVYSSLLANAPWINNELESLTR